MEGNWDNCERKLDPEGTDEEGTVRVELAEESLVKSAVETAVVSGCWGEWRRDLGLRRDVWTGMIAKGDLQHG